MDTRGTTRAIGAFATFAACFAVLALAMAVLSPLALWKASKGGSKGKKDECGEVPVPATEPCHDIQRKDRNQPKNQVSQGEEPKTPDIGEATGKQVDLEEELHRAKFWNSFETERNEEETRARIAVGSNVKENVQALLGGTKKHRNKAPDAQDVSYHELLQAMGLPTFEASE
uniref:Uncharacterized protein n=1 Tax=Picocystis salinarum TaxID=88271 RepID=A0A7S3UDU7_9CHLO|mmetsp:Transcript_980/g.3791  ORF Transcript_980/g.3791 Transcript_980/m.3791 type:complete len:172 (+) Transcript_980:318-833(+)